MRVVKNISSAIQLAITISCSLTFQISFSQGNEKSVIISALKDEMARSMKELKWEGHEKPFYISYGISDIKSFHVSASLGVLTDSDEIPARSKSVRVLVGNYDFNDESLEESGGTRQTNEIDLPVDDDYYGIRRAMWTTTESVYKGAARQYKKNLAALKEQKKELKDFPHRSFAQLPPRELFVEGPTQKADKEAMEKYVKEISFLFNQYPEIISSGVNLNAVEGYQYFVNSEGTVAKTPVTFASVDLYARTKSVKGQMISEWLNHVASVPGKLPSKDQLEKELKALIEKLKQNDSGSFFEDDYSGPLLFYGESVAAVLSYCLFSEDGLMATNQIPGQNKYNLESKISMESKMGKSIVNESITVKAMPGLKEYKGTELLGTFYIDDEGVIPADELVLIEKGILKALLNDRTLTNSNQAANGFGSGPGVLQVSFSEGQTDEQLKKILISKAKEEGLDYALILRGDMDRRMGSMDVYKVSLTDGKEDRLRSAGLSSVSLKSLRKAKFASSEMVAHNFVSGFGMNNATSTIVPNGIILDDVDIQSAGHPNEDEEDEFFVEPPKRNNR